MRKRFTLIDIADHTGLETAVIAEWADENEVAIENGNYVFNGSDLRALCDLAEELNQEQEDPSEGDEPEEDEPEDDQPEDDEPEDDDE